MMPRLYAFLLVLAAVFVAIGLPVACSQPSAPPSSEPDASVLGSPPQVVTDPASGIPGRPTRTPRPATPPTPTLPTPRKVVVDKRSQEAQLTAACTGTHGEWLCSKVPHQQLMAAGGNATAANCGPACTIGVWDVDPLNTSGCASDGNSCTSAACGGVGIGPCSTRAQIIQRVGSPTPIYPFAQSVSINYVSQGPDSGADPWFAPQLSGGGTLSFTGAGYYSANWTTIGDSYVFRPGGVPGGNVYTSWPPLYAALPPAGSAGARSPTTIQIDDSIVSPVVVPAGSYNLDSVTWVGVADENTNTGGAALNFASGVTIVPGSAGLTMRFAGSILASYLGAAACITNSGAAQETNIFVSEASQLQSTGAGAFLAVTNGFGVIGVVDASILGDGTHATMTNAAPGTAIVHAYGNSKVQAAATIGAGATVFWDTSLPGAQGAGATATQTIGQLTVGVVGASGLPVFFGAGTPFSVAVDASLTAAQEAFPTYHLTGTVPAAGSTLVVPNVIGAPFFLDLSAVTLTGTLTIQAGTGATKATVTAANLSATGQQGIIVQVTASNVVVRQS